MRGFDETSFLVKIVDEKNGNFIGKYKLRKVLLTGDITGIKIGDYVRIKGEFISFDKSWYKGYNEKIYYFSNNIFDKFKISSNKIMGFKDTIFFQIRRFLDNGPEIYKKYSSFILLGIKSRDNSDIYRILKELSLVHLFVISGFHIMIFYSTLYWLIGLLPINKKILLVIIISIILFYLYLLNFPVSSTRAFIFLVGITINKLFLNNKISKINILSCVAIMFIIYNPYVVLSLSYILSFLATFIILFSIKIKIKNKWRKLILIYTLIYLGMLPITINLNGYATIFGIIYSIIFTPIIGVYYILTLFLFPFKNIMSYIFWTLEFILNSFSVINIILPVNKIIFEFIFSYYIIYLTCILFGEKINILLIKTRKTLSRKLVEHR